MHGRNKDWHHVKEVAVRVVTLGIVLILAVSPAFAQDPPDPSATDQTPAQGVDQAQPDQGPGQDQGASPAGDVTGASSSTAAPDPATVTAQWGLAPSIGPDADKAVAQRWFREQNVLRARWDVPIATRDPYLDWQAENLLRSQLGQPQQPLPPGLSRPGVITQASPSDQAVLSEPQFWTISDDLWQAWLDSIESQPPAGWTDERPGEPWFTRENYLQLFKLQQTPRFDKYRLLGVAGRVDTSGSSPTDLLSGHQNQLEQLAPGAVAAYEPVVYPDNLVAVIGYDLWINPDGSIRP